MDRNVVIATVLIALIMVVWLTWLTPPVAEPLPPATQDSLQAAQPTPAPEEELPPPAIVPPPDLSADRADSTMILATSGVVREIKVVSELYEATFSTKGATPISWKLRSYEKAGGGAVEMIDSLQQGAVAAVFTAQSNRNYDTRQFVFESDGSDLITVGDGGAELTFSTVVGSGRLTYRYSFVPDNYEMTLDVTMEGSESFLSAGGYDLVWNGAIPFTEHEIEDEGKRSGVFAQSGGEVEQVTLSRDAYGERSLRGEVSWTVVKNKYFLAAIIPEAESRGAELIGERIGATDDPMVRQVYSAALSMPVPGNGVTDRFTMYVGPLEFNRINDYHVGLYDTVDYGWDFFETITRPLAKFVFIPVFTYLGSVLPNYGLVIILLALLIKMVLYPLTKSSFKSMARMRELQPKMEAIKEKYADNQQKQQEATMKMYKETGVNPLGGCLPMLLQYPVIIALWQYLPQSIQIRQQGFLWAADLSAPDVILNLPFDIPLYGNFVAGFTLLMGISMVFQMRMSTGASSNAQAKIMMYVFPIMLFVIFNRFAAGLNLYYLCYNVLTAGQQQLINRQLKKESEEEEKNPKAKKSSGWASSKKPAKGSKKGASKR